MESILQRMPHIGTQTFKRNQVEWALWRVFCKLGQRAPQPPTQFTTRVKRLLDLDRDLEVPHGVDDPAFARYAYSDAPPPGKGSDAEFLAGDAFCLAVGLDLLDLGLNQQDVLFLGRGVREVLLQAFEIILKGPPRDMRGALNPNDFPTLPTYRPERRARRRASSVEGETVRTAIVDPAVYLLIRRVELKTTLPDHTQAALRSDLPVFLGPIVCQGSEALGRQLAELRLQERKAIVLEVGYSASALCRWLSQAPVSTRGRAKG